MPKTKPARRQIAYVKLPSNVANTSVSNRNEAFNVKEHSYCMKDKTATQSPTKAKLRKKIKNLQQKLRRQNLKISSLTGLIKNMRNRKLLEKAPADLLQDQFSGLTLEMFQNQMKNSVRKPEGRRYNEEIKKFALTLHFYSPKAYLFVRKVLHLPHPASLRNWQSSVECEPGFLKDVLENLALQVANNINMSDCALMMDAMAIRKQVIYDKTKAKFTGFVDYGGCIPEHREEQASEALGFLLVGLRSHWKAPIGYFLTNKTNAAIQASLVKSALSLVADSGFRVWSLTCDGTATNFETLRLLGCSFTPNYDKMVVSFKHPTRPYNVYSILDACHMVKLARNTLGDYGKFHSGSGHVISWEYIEKLCKLQDDEGLTLANKIGINHTKWQQHKMKVKYAVQTLSSSVAKALTFLQCDLKHPDFQNCGPTVDFINTIDKLFDILNSRYAYARGFKHPIRIQNLEGIEKTFIATSEYLLALNSTERQLLVYSRHKTFILGFVMTMKSIILIAKELLVATERPFNYILTYKFSQDHIELLFACIRGRGGSNNNLNTLQFKYAMRNLLLQNSIVASSKANVMSFNEYCTGSLFSLKWTKHRSPIQEDPQDDEVSDEEAKALSENLDKIALSDFTENIIYYIAGFIVRNVMKNLDCSQCSEALTLDCTADEHDYVPAPFSLFLIRKNNGGLVEASYGVQKIITLCEKIFREKLKGTRKDDMRINSKEFLIRKMTNDILRARGESLRTYFPSFAEHAHENDPVFEDDHLTQIVKNICEKYLFLRMQTYAKQYTRQIVLKNTPSVRHQMNKLVLFKNV